MAASLQELRECVTLPWLQSLLELVEVRGFVSGQITIHVNDGLVQAVDVHKMHRPKERPLVRQTYQSRRG